LPTYDRKGPAGRGASHVALKQARLLDGTLPAKRQVQDASKQKRERVERPEERGSDRRENRGIQTGQTSYSCDAGPGTRENGLRASKLQRQGIWGRMGSEKEINTVRLPRNGRRRDRQANPYAPAPLRSPQVPVQGNSGVGNLNPFANQYQQFAGRPQLQQPANPQYGQQQPFNLYEGQQAGMMENNQFQAQGAVGGGGMQPPNQLFGNPGAAPQIGIPGAGVQQPGWVRQGGPIGSGGAGIHQKVPLSGDGRARSGGAESERGRRNSQEGSNKEVMERLASFEKKLNMQSARVGIEAEMCRQQAQINSEKNPGLFAQMDIAFTIYSAPRTWAGVVALAGGLSAVLKLPTSKLASWEMSWSRQGYRCAVKKGRT
jgi:hypothetical protein